jgi:hypothetical protein
MDGQDQCAPVRGRAARPRRLAHRREEPLPMKDPVDPLLVQPVLPSAVAGSVRSTGTGTRCWLKRALKRHRQVARAGSAGAGIGASVASPPPGSRRGSQTSSAPLPCKPIPVETIDLRLPGGCRRTRWRPSRSTDAITAIGWPSLTSGLTADRECLDLENVFAVHRGRRSRRSRVDLAGRHRAAAPPSRTPAGRPHELREDRPTRR